MESTSNITYLNKTEFEQYTPTLQDAINEIIHKEGYITGKVCNNSMSTGGANYMGDLFLIDVIGETLNGSKETHLFVKINATRNAGHVAVSEAHLCEIYFYEELAKIFIELQDSAKIPQNERLFMIKSYAAYKEAIILENMAIQGFTMPDRMEVYPLKFGELSVQQLARLHGLSFVLQKERPEYYDKKLRPRKYALQWNDEFKLMAKNLMNITLEAIDDDTKKVVEACKDVVFMNYAKYHDLIPNEKSTVYCICHGDYRNGNILMKKTDGEVEKVIPVDYQSLYHGCPVNDLIYLIYTGTDYKFRKEHMLHLKDMYYKTLDEFLQYFKLDVEEIYPKEEFEKVFKERLDLALLLIIMWGPMMFINEKDVPEDEGKEKVAMHEMKFKPENEFVERLLGTLEEFKEYGYFNNLLK